MSLTEAYSSRCLEEVFSEVWRVYRGLCTDGLSSCGGPTLMVRQMEGTTRLPSGYQLDLVGDPCVVVLRREDGTVVARFTHNADPQEVRRAAEEDHRGTPEADGRIPTFMFTQPHRRCVLRNLYTGQSLSSSEQGGKDAWQ
jgi:hypothetical protein